MPLTSQAQDFLKELRSNGFLKAAYYVKKYRTYNLPEVAEEEISVPSDSWNAGSDHRIIIAPGAMIKIVSTTEAYSLGAFGADADQLIGLWVTGKDFRYS